MQVVSYSRPNFKKATKAAVCPHDYKTFKETIKSDNKKFDSSNLNAYFIVRGCVLCHDKQYLEYTLEKL